MTSATLASVLVARSVGGEGELVRAEPVLVANKLGPTFNVEPPAEYMFSNDTGEFMLNYKAAHLANPTDGATVHWYPIEYIIVITLV